MNVTVDIKPGSDLFEQLAQRAAEIIQESRQQTATSDDGWVRGAEAIAEYIGATKWRVYNLRRARRIWPVKTDGSNLVARKSDLDKWIDEGGAVSL